MGKKLAIKLYNIYGNLHYKKVIQLIDKLDVDDPYGPRYLSNPTKKPTFKDLTPLTQGRLIKNKFTLDE